MEFEAEIRDIIAETSDTKTLRVDRPAYFGFVSGQFVNVTLMTPEDGRVRRAYSIASSPLEPHIDLTVRQLPGGLVSKILTDDVSIGDRLNLRGPYGRFVFEERKLGLYLINVGYQFVACSLAAVILVLWKPRETKEAAIQTA